MLLLKMIQAEYSGSFKCEYMIWNKGATRTQDKPMWKGTTRMNKRDRTETDRGPRPAWCCMCLCYVLCAAGWLCGRYWLYGGRKWRAGPPPHANCGACVLPTITDTLPYLDRWALTKHTLYPYSHYISIVHVMSCKLYHIFIYTYILMFWTSEKKRINFYFYYPSRWIYKTFVIPLFLWKNCWYKYRVRWHV